MSERSEFIKKASKKYSKGKFTASQTGAKQFAKKRYEGQQLRDTLESAGSMESFEKSIEGSKRPKRTKRY